MTINFQDQNHEHATPRIETLYVSEVIGVPFSDAADALAGLAGRTILAGSDRLEISDHDNDGTFQPYDRVAAVLHLHGILPRSVHVDLALSPWSAQRTEVGMTPSGKHFSLLPSAATERYLRSARATTGQLASELSGVDRAAASDGRKSA